MNADVATRVARGMAVLDRELPGWWQRINLDRLDMAGATYFPPRPTSCGCILAQVNALPDRDGNYFDQRDALAGEDEADIAGWAEDHGFNGQYEELEQAWRRAITTRRAAP